VVVKNPFNPFMVEPASPPATVANLERRLSMAERAADQARRDLAAEKARKGLQAEDDDGGDDRLARWRRQGALDERARILAILTNPIAARQPRLAEKFALESDVPARDAIVAMEENERVNAASRAKSLADQIILASKKAKGEVACEVTAGPKVFVKMTAEDILRAAAKAHGQD
jgi:hypothetical protein